MLRFFIGLAFGVILTISAFGAGGVGHGTYAPLIFTDPFVILLPDSVAIVAVLAGPLLWAAYFQFIPKIKRGSARLITLAALLVTHLLAGIFVAVNDPAFARALGQERRGLIGFAIIVVLAMSTLLVFSLRERIRS